MIRRTAAITAASIAGVVLAAGAAIGANIGILSAADDGELGDLSAQAVVTTTGAADAATVGTSADPAGSEVFAVDTAGTVEVVRDGVGLRLGEVVALPGWTWTTVTETPDHVRVRFTQGSEQLDFVARTAGASIEASVERVPVATTTAPTTDRHDDDDDHEYDDDDHDDEYDDDHEYEGRDDDD